MSAAESPAFGAQVIQGVFTFGGKKFGKKKHGGDHGKFSKAFDQLWKSIPKGSRRIGDKKILGALLDHADDIGLPADATHADLMKAVAAKRPPETKKRKRDEKPEQYLERREDASIGKKVDFKTDRYFRTERRLRRLAPQIAGRNVYMTRHEEREPVDTSTNPPPAKRRRFKVVTASHPPGSLPKGHEGMSDEMIAALTKTGHSEAVTKRVEDNFSQLEKTKRLTERTTREQCKDCRYNYPSQDDADHAYGFQYSGPTDHLPKGPIHDKVHANQGKVGGLDLSDAERETFNKAADSATWARQHDPHQNPLLDATMDELGSKDSDDDFSDDDEDIHIDPTLMKMLPAGTTTLGKATLHPILPDTMMSTDEMSDQKAWVKSQRQKASASTEAEVEAVGGD